MSSAGTVTGWIQGIRTGDPVAARGLWERYFKDLVRVARWRLGDSPRRVADEEDVAVSSFHAVCAGLQKGRFPEIESAEGFWMLLTRVAARKAVDLVRHNRRLKRRVLGASAVHKVPADAAAPEFAGVAGNGPSPDAAVEAAERFQMLLAVLSERGILDVAIAKMEGQTNEEIAKGRNCSIRTIERELSLIRQIWEKCAG